MDQYILVAILVIGFLIFRTFSKNTGGAKMVMISPLDAKKRLDTENEIILLDVRTKSEYLGRHIPKSILIPLDVLANEAGKRLPDKNKQIIVYCQSGSRSAAAVNSLLKLGYTHVYNLGGISRWPYETVSGGK